MVIFGINADISKAHRRVLVRESDWGVQACRTCSTSQTIWLNRVGTFGVASAAYRWARLMGLVGRFGLNILLNDWVFVFIFVDDLHVAAGGKNRWNSIWVFLVALEMVGTPFSYHKFRGGFQLDYVGFWMDYGRFEIGLSEKRASWIIGFANQDRVGWMARRHPKVPGVSRKAWIHFANSSLDQALAWTGVRLAGRNGKDWHIQDAGTSGFGLHLRPR